MSDNEYRKLEVGTVKITVWRLQGETNEQFEARVTKAGQDAIHRNDQLGAVTRHERRFTSYDNTFDPR